MGDDNPDGTRGWDPVHGTHYGDYSTDYSRYREQQERYRREDAASVGVRTSRSDWPPDGTARSTMGSGVIADVLGSLVMLGAFVAVAFLLVGQFFLAPNAAQQSWSQKVLNVAPLIALVVVAAALAYALIRLALRFWWVLVLAALIYFFARPLWASGRIEAVGQNPAAVTNPTQNSPAGGTAQRSDRVRRGSMASQQTARTSLPGPRATNSQ